MADLKIKLHPILKGMKLEVTVEEAINDILLVCLNYGSLIYRGVLLDVKKRNLPTGISFPNQPKKPDPGGNNKVNTQNPDKCGVGIAISATSHRHSYLKDPFEILDKPAPLTSFSIMKRKTIRDIRLRPRKTLCTNCKANIHDSKLLHNPQTNQIKLKSSSTSSCSMSRSTRLHPQCLSPPLQLRKRQLSTDDESPSKSPHTQDKVVRTNLSPRLMTNTSSYMNNRSSRLYSRCMAGRKKSTPAIKISIGGDPVLKIPPRVSENDSSYKSEMLDSDRALIKKELTVRLTDIAEQAHEYTALKKVKKCVKKFKDSDSKPEIENVPIVTYQELTPIINVISEIPQTKSESLISNVHISSHPKKHKRKHKHERHRNSSAELNKNVNKGNDSMPNKSTGNYNLVSDEWKNELINSSKTESPNSNDFYGEVSEDYDEDNENNVPFTNDADRPRLVYTWKQNKGLSRVDTKFAGTKDYPLRSKDKETDKYLSPRNDGNVTSYSDGEDSSVNEMSDCDDVSECQTSDSEAFLPPDISASPDKNMETFKPLMMKIQTQTVSKIVTTDGRKLQINDIVWGKIQGFPWWPGRVLSISITKKDTGLVIAQLAHVAWFGSPTRSHMQCDELFPFLEDFKVRYNKKKRGPYKLAIQQATLAARSAAVNTDVQNLIENIPNVEI